MTKFRLSLFVTFIFFLTGCEKEEVIPLSNGKKITKCLTHRGYVDPSNPRLFQNSMSALNESFRMGADGTEFDIHVTKDGEPILSHDSTFKKLAKSRPGRSCPLTTEIRNLNLAEILDNCVLLNGEDIPTFEDVLSNFSGRNFFLLLDFKSTPNARTISLIKKYYEGNYKNIVSLVTFSINLNEAYTLRSKLPTKLILSSATFTPGTENGFDGIEARKISSMDISYLQQKGKEISIYDVDDYSTLKYFVDKNVTYLTTDKITNCLEAKR